MVFCLLAFAQFLNAQKNIKPCMGVVASTFPLNPQAENSNYYGVRVALGQPYSQDVTVVGGIHASDNEPAALWTLTIPAGSLTAETAATYYQTNVGVEVTVDIQSVNPCPGTSLLTMNAALQSFINQKLSEINAVGGSICSQVNSATSDVSGGSGVLTFPNWVRLLQVGTTIDSLNSVWDNVYAQMMNAIVDYAFANGAVNGQDNEDNRSEVWDIIEENYFVIPENKASSCLEQKFSFTSLQTQISNSEDAWLAAGNTDMSLNPALNEELPEEYWSLMGSNRTVNITDPNIANQLLGDTQDSDSTKKDILSKIKDIIEIIGGILDGIEQVGNLMKDCSSSTEKKISAIRDGFHTQDNKHIIGYEMEQKDVTFDFNSTVTKIKGKAKLYKIKKNGKPKKDRKDLVGINFCARESDACDGTEWPVNGLPYIDPVITAKKKVKTEFHQPGALRVSASYHFLQFKFYFDDRFEKALNLLATIGCN